MVTRTPDPLPHVLGEAVKAFRDAARWIEFVPADRVLRARRLENESSAVEVALAYPTGEIRRVTFSDAAWTQLRDEWIWA